MQRDMAAKQEELAKRRFEGSSGGGAVRVAVSGLRHVLELRITREAVDPAEVELLEDLILTALNDALHKAEETYARELGELTGGLGLPGLM